MKSKIIIIFFGFLWLKNLNAQDPIFTQYFFIPQTINTAFIGIKERPYAGVIHRTQWPDLQLRIDTDYLFYNTFLNDSNSSFGLSILNQKERFSNYSLSQLNLGYAYRVQINRDWYLRLAVDAGLGRKAIGFSNFILSDQIDINSEFISPNSTDPLVLRDQILYPDFSAGILFNSESSWFGVAIKHLNKPNIAFSSEGNLPLNMFYSIHASHQFLIADFINPVLFPYNTEMILSTNYMRQGEFQRLDISSTIQLESSLYFGVTSVSNLTKKNLNKQFLTSLNVFTGMDFENLGFGISYDFNTSKIKRTGGIYEIVLTYKFGSERCFGCSN